MILGFKEFFDAKKTRPTYFREKILGEPIIVVREIGGKFRKFQTGALEVPHRKLHTIRSGNRWKAGDTMHMAYGVRTQNYFQFNKGIPELEKCVSVQRIGIHYTHYAGSSRMVSIGVDAKVFWHGIVTETGANSCAIVDESRRIIEDFASNDGFKDSIEFFQWFNKDFSGQIIHFSDFRYE